MLLEKQHFCRTHLRTHKSPKLSAASLSHLSQASGEQNALVKLAHPLQKLVDVRPLEHVNLMHRAVNLHWHHKVRVIDGLKRAVHQSLV